MHRTSLSASGTPASGPSGSPEARRSSTARAAARAPSESTCRNAWTSRSTAPTRSRCARVTSTAEAVPWLTRCGELGRGATYESFAVLASLITPPRRGCAGPGSGRPREGPGAPERASACVRPGRDDVRAEDVGQRQRVRRRRDVVGGDLGHPGHRAEDHVQLAGQMVELAVGQVDAREPREVRDVGTGQRRHATPGSVRTEVYSRRRVVILGGPDVRPSLRQPVQALSLWSVTRASGVRIQAAWSCSQRVAASAGIGRATKQPCALSQPSDRAAARPPRSRRPPRRPACRGRARGR